MKTFKLGYLTAIFVVSFLILNIINCAPASKPADAVAAPTANGTGGAAGGGTTQYTLGGSVSGLTAGQSVTVSDGTQSIAMSTNASFTFTAKVNSGAAYNVTIASVSALSLCSINNGSGTAAANVTNVAVVCSLASAGKTVGGTLTGLGTTPLNGLVLQLNGGNDLTLTTGTSYTFNTSLAVGATYSVTVKTQPSFPKYTCTMANSSGTIAANVINANVTCAINTYAVGGTITGLTAAGLTLRLNGNAPDDIVIPSGSNSFLFNLVPRNDGTQNIVTIPVQPGGGLTCYITNGTVTLSGANSTATSILCSAIPMYTLTGTIDGLAFGETASFTIGNGNNATVTGNGSFHDPIGFTPVINGTSWTLSVISSPSVSKPCSVLGTSTGTIAAANVTTLSAQCGFKITGTVTQTSGINTTGLVHVNLYSSATEIVTPTSAIPNLALAGTYTFYVPNGTWYVRSFLDSKGPGGTAPDGYPTMDTVAANADAQAPKLTAVIAGADQTHNLSLIDVSVNPDQYKAFDTYTYNESAQAELANYRPSWNHDPYALQGTGYCKGYRMQIQADLVTASNTANLSLPIVKIPNGSTVTLKNDGACGTNIANNTSSSYDATGPYFIGITGSGTGYTTNPTVTIAGAVGATAVAKIDVTSGKVVAVKITNYGTGTPTTVTFTGGTTGTVETGWANTAMGDFTYSYGIANPTSAHAGNYAFFYTSTPTTGANAGLGEFAHAQVDNIATVNKLPNPGFITYGSGGLSAAGVSSSLTPVINWPAVTGASTYMAKISQNGNSTTYNSGTRFAGASYTAAPPLTDLRSYTASIDAFDAAVGVDVDAKSSSFGESYFMTDTAGTNTVTIAGTITNNNTSIITPSAANPFYLITRGFDGFSDSITSVTSAGAYSVTVLSGASTNGELALYYDSEGSGNPYTLANNNFKFQKRTLNLAIAMTGKNFTLNPFVQLVSPANNATGVGNQPTFTWTDYATTAPAYLPAANRIIGLTIANRGTGCTAGTYPLAFTGVGTGATGTITIGGAGQVATGTMGGAVVDLYTIKTQGSGYTGSPTVTIPTIAGCTGGNIPVLTPVVSSGWGYVVVGFSPDAGGSPAFLYAPTTTSATSLNFATLPNPGSYVDVFLTLTGGNGLSTLSSSPSWTWSVSIGLCVPGDATFANCFYNIFNNGLDVGIVQSETRYFNP